jgi:SAM-dependent methyltransferase
MDIDAFLLRLFGRDPRLSRLWDLLEQATGAMDSLTPPLELRLKVGPFLRARDYRQAGSAFVDILRRRGGLREDARILDIGCGCGQTATPLTGSLGEKGRYEGLDIAAQLIEWARRHVTSRDPRFRFQRADVYNGLYNPHGKSLAHEYRFPYDDESFDFVLLKSVFTHLLPRDLEHYLSQVARVLANGGRCLITYFLLDQESRKRMHAPAALDFRYPLEGCFTANERHPEAALAYDEDAIRSLYRRSGLSIVEPVDRGSWRGRSEASSDFQDLVVAEKKRPSP